MINVRELSPNKIQPIEIESIIAQFQIVGTGVAGIYELPHEVYHHPKCPGLSRSAILELLKSPKHYQEWLKNPPEPTPKMEFGATAHAALLEPELFDQKFTHYPNSEEFEGRSKAAIEARENFQKQNADKKIIKAEDYARIGKIVSSLYSAPEAVELLKAGVKEHSIFFNSEGVLCKIKPDILDEKTIIDLKITANASKEGFKKSAAYLDYHIQAAFYLDGAQAKNFKFLCVEDEEPFDVAIYELDEDSIQLGRARYQEAIQIFKACQKNSKWEGYSKQTQTIRLPSWKFYENEGEIL